MIAAAAKPGRTRRTNEELGHVLACTLKCLGQYNEPITIRHLFYRLANDFAAIPKTEDAYNNLRALLCKWRRSGEIPMGAFIDGTRWHYGFEGYKDAVSGMLDLARRSYRLNIWQDSGRYVEIWVEKDAVASIVHPIASEWNLKTFVTRGDASISSLHCAAQTFNAALDDGRVPTIIYLGDYDEVGLAIPEKIQANLKRDHHCHVDMRRVAVNESHIREWRLPTRPSKGPRRGRHLEEAVELDVLRPEQVRGIITDEICGMVDATRLEAMKQIEEAERETMEAILLAPSTRGRLAQAWDTRKEAGEV